MLSYASSVPTHCLVKSSCWEVTGVTGPRLEDGRRSQGGWRKSGGLVLS